MPEPPKITTSLADRIARLNATQKSSDRNHTTEKKEIGEIKSKISKYEATGQYEAPLVPKGSFGLGAPLAKPERGLDRIRIASSGVSGGMTMDNSVKSASPNPSFRSVSLGRSNRLSTASVDLGTPQHQHTTPPSSEIHPHSPSHSPIATPKLASSTSSIINQATTSEDEESDPAQENSRDSSQVYDGILEGYPTTPAAEDGPPTVTCSNCLKSIELEILADHFCELSVDHTDSNGPDHDTSLDESRGELFPVDVPESPDHKLSESLEQEESQPTPTNNLRTTLIEESGSSAEIPPKATENSTNMNIKEEEPIEKKVDDTTTDQRKTLKENNENEKLNNRSSDSSSRSTNTTSRMSSSNRAGFRGTSPIYRSWHDDDDDDAYSNSDGATGFVTIVRSSSRI